MEILNKDNSYVFILFQAFCDFLAQPNVLRELNIANTECALDLVIFFSSFFLDFLNHFYSKQLFQHCFLPGRNNF